MGPGMTAGGKRFERRTYVSSYVQHKLQPEQKKEWETHFNEFANIDLTQSFSSNDRRMPLPSEEQVNKVLASMGKFSPRDHLNCGACGYDTFLEHAIAIVEGLAEV